MNDISLCLGQRRFAAAFRPDTALFWLPRVHAPTLFMVEDMDPRALLAYEKLAGRKELIAVPSASDRFTESLALDTVAQHASRWFSRYLISQPAEVPTMEVTND
jgi:hypothetical protein